MATAPQPAMEPAVMKRMLIAARLEPVNCAVALDQNVGLLLLDKIKQPRALEQMLTKQSPTAKNPRFGAAWVDKDESRTLKLRLDRPTSGMARHLTKTIKGTGLNKVVIVLEDETLVEEYDAAREEQGATNTSAEAFPAPDSPVQPGEPTAAAPTEPDPPANPNGHALHDRLAELVARVVQVQDPVQKGTLATLAGQANTLLKAGSADASQAIDRLEQALATPTGSTQATSGPPDLHTLQHALAGLIPQIAALAPDRRAPLASLAGAANTKLKASDLTGAASDIETLRQALSGTPAAPDEVGDTSGAPVDVLTIWQEAKEQVDFSLEDLAKELRSLDDPEMTRIADFGLAGIGSKENTSLMVAAMEYNKAPDSSREAASAKLRKAISNYRALITTDELVKTLDENPFGVPVAIRFTLAKAFDQIERAL